jgi:7-cyano-7-deazaguanine reductase
MSIEATHLGKQSNYPQHYDPSVLVAVPRKLNRLQYGISDEALCFTGFDVWHAYEFSFLTLKGAPVIGILKIVYPVSNKFLVESKSLKLYLNSFNMECYGETRNEGISIVIGIIKKDLSELLDCDVLISYYNHNQATASFDFDDFSILEETIDFNDFHCDRYKESPELLVVSQAEGLVKWGTHLLRSNCKITLQPDWGSLYIEIAGNKLPTPESFLKYIVSLRNENHFHEEICEMVFQRISDQFKPNQLMVTCLYTRRGGIDICPIRISRENSDLNLNLTSVNILDKSAFRQ